MDIANKYFLQAIYSGDLETVKNHLDSGADVHTWNDHALLFASEQGHYEMVALLLAYGADVDSNGGLALALAVENGNSDIIDLLQEWMLVRNI